jgi:hypothetical protein
MILGISKITKSLIIIIRAIEQYEFDAKAVQPNNQITYSTAVGFWLIKHALLTNSTELTMCSNLNDRTPITEPYSTYNWS